MYMLQYLKISECSRPLGVPEIDFKESPLILQDDMQDVMVHVHVHLLGRDSMGFFYSAQALRPLVDQEHYVSEPHRNP